MLFPRREMRRKEKIQILEGWCTRSEDRLLLPQGKAAYVECQGNVVGGEQDGCRGSSILAKSPGHPDDPSTRG